MKFSARIFLFASVLAFLFLLVSSSAHAANLLQNPGFEELLYNWKPSSGLKIPFNFTIASNVKRGGNYSALVKHSKTGSYGAGQVIKNITAGQNYSAKGYVFFNNEDAKNARLRIAWYSSEDGSGAQMKTVNSNIIEIKSPLWQNLDTGEIKAPAGACSAEFRILLASSDGKESFIYFDDLSFEVVEPLLISFTLPSEATAGEGFDVAVTVKNADPSTEYYAKAMIGESTESASLRKGYTYNSILDKWLAWNGAWSKMPTFETDTDGDASFTLKSKVKDDASSGTYYYLVRIRKVGTKENLDSDAKTFFVNESSGTSSSSGSSDPEITFSVEGGDLKVNKSFDVKIEIKNAKPLHDYYVKIRLGLSESKLTKGRTYDSFYDKWLADNKSWSKFPILYTDSSGTWDGTISAKVASGNPADTYIIGVRIRDKEMEKNYDSETQTITVGAEEPPDLPSVALAKEGADGAVLGTLTELPTTGGGGWLPVLIWMLLIFIGSSLPGASVSENRTMDFLAHKLVHLFEYSILFILIHRAIKRSFSFTKETLFATFSFLLTVSYAITDEIHQLFVRGRDAKFHDIIIDAIAAVFGWLIIRRKKTI